MGFVAHQVTPRNAPYLQSTLEVTAGLLGSAAPCHHKPAFSRSRDSRSLARGQGLSPTRDGSYHPPSQRTKRGQLQTSTQSPLHGLGEQEKPVCHHPHCCSPHHPKYTNTEMCRLPEKTAELRSQSHPSPSAKSFRTNARGRRYTKSARRRRENGERRTVPCWGPALTGSWK